MSLGAKCHGDTLVMHPRPWPDQTFNIHVSKVILCVWFGQLSVVCYKVWNPRPTITGSLYWTNLMRWGQELKDTKLQYKERLDKVILLHDNFRPHVANVVKTYLRSLKWDVLPSLPHSPDVSPLEVLTVSIHSTSPCWPTVLRLWTSQELGWFVDRFEWWYGFPTEDSYTPTKDERNYWLTKENSLNSTCTQLLLHKSIKRPIK